ncbi:ankyrin repeat domain-containing protein [Micromonospora sp. NBC_00898]|uniref:ankyrin repeat domain-containing protein n=1 Tax=Micromonospora sp. NBC_00898 TaxID=2975981 RepID=UPI0038655B08|nr:ankyrin repeat domain-containing protein [Micromonospora sp. NBC_00898]
MHDDDRLAVELTAVVVGGEVERLTRLLRRHPELATASVVDRNGGVRSPLHLLADAPGHRPRAAETVRVLVGAGADPEAQAGGMWHTERPLHWAASNDDVLLIDALLDAGADLEALGSSIDGGPPLSSAVGYGQWHAARRLVDRGGRTELWHAAALGLLPVVARLTEDATDLDGPLWNACRGGQLATARFLVERGVRPGGWRRGPAGRRSMPRAPAGTGNSSNGWRRTSADRVTDRPGTPRDPRPS